jgi:hypothetical protein
VLKDFVQSTIGTEFLAEQALKLAGLPQDEIDEGIADVCCELAKCFPQDGRLSNLHVGFAIAAPPRSMHAKFAGLARTRPAK